MPAGISECILKRTCDYGTAGNRDFSCVPRHVAADTGTGLAPMVSWSTTGSYTATTLGVGNLAFLPYAPMLWLSIVFSIIFAVTGIATAKAKED